MYSQNMNMYNPDYVVLPGEILEEYMQLRRMSRSELAQRAGLTCESIDDIITGEAPLLPDIALKLERILGRPAHFWHGLQVQYCETLERLTDDTGNEYKVFFAWQPE